MEPELELSVIVLAWDQLEYTRRCVASIREGTDVDYELIVVDNGSADEAASFARGAADRVILNADNLGFAVGMNQGLAVAGGRYVAFVNNDTELPASWSSMLIETFEAHAMAGIVLPAVTAAGNPFAVRSEAGTEVVVVPRFRFLPSGVLYMMERAVALDLGGWDERYEVASREDLDLLFTVWVNGREVVLDERVLVEHASNVTAKAQLPDRDKIWRTNGQVFVDKWAVADPVDIKLLAHSDLNRVDRLVSEAQTVATWLGRVLATENRLNDRIDDWKSEVRNLKQEVRVLERDMERDRERLQRPPMSVLQRVVRKARSLGGGR